MNPPRDERSPLIKKKIEAKNVCIAHLLIHAVQVQVLNQV